MQIPIDGLMSMMEDVLGLLDGKRLMRYVAMMDADL